MINQTKQLFDTFYDSTYRRWRLNKEKAGKDIVGEEYEKMRESFYNIFGLTAKKGRIAGYNADLIVKDKNGKIVIIEEDKGHYVDSCFLKRFLCNAAEIIDAYMESGEEVPYIVLSSPTTLGSYNKAYAKVSKLFRHEIKKMMDLKIVYLPYCNHDRVKNDSYYTSTDNCFKISDTLITNQLKLVEKATRGV